MALLFLTKGSLPQELVWKVWLEGAVGFIPHQRLPMATVSTRGGRRRGWADGCFTVCDWYRWWWDAGKGDWRTFHCV